MFSSSYKAQNTKFFSNDFRCQVVKICFTEFLNTSGLGKN